MQEPVFCPYPGLRPFNEEESIFFKGREEHVEKIISLLEKNKFLMLTGASGDGKSSLVYAGLIPSARAGFFKARFNNWLVADFRPERSPLKNLAKSLAGRLNFDAEHVEKEISFGFSSLVNLYKSSPFYIDYTSQEWILKDDLEKKKAKRKGANLLILVDQFEEFFTNPENYIDGKPSVQAQTVINLLLETAQIALSEDLPIYIICTMRSDYIGQCASFRGLPEYIGFSQFFVPRLKRKEIHQVIEEPALLSGHKISNRLTETLINQLSNGFDQLPVLQHTLNQIWNLTDNSEEMDVLHLSKLAGIAKETLPEQDKINFNKWFNNLPEFKKKFHETSSLENVLNAHANELYEKSINNYNEKHNKKISLEDARFVIKTVFQCLTKIDNSRAVRNRMTLQEITSLIDRPDITSDVVSGLLDLFRMQGNTFLKPFINDDADSYKLKDNDVLDITHESLIRNWDLLRDWAEEEDQNRQIYLDFQKQLDRWIINNKSNHYLLASGPLSYFELWYNKCRPNKHWLLKYDESDKSLAEKNKIAEETIKNAREFISRSQNAIKRKRNVFIIATSIIILFLSSFTVWALLERQNAVSQQQIATEKTQEAIKSEEQAHLAEQDALKAKNTALVLKENAEKSEANALTAKEAAIKAQKEAVGAKAIAEIERLKAEKQSVLANDQSKKAEEQRKIASEARDNALIAEQKAKKLTLISVSQALALKSATIEDDAQLQSLLAVQSFNFTLLNKENVQSPIIYEALRSAYFKANSKNKGVVEGLLYEPRSINSNSQGTDLLSIGKSGIINEIDIATNSIKSTHLIPDKKLINYTLLSPDNKKIVTAYDDGRLLLWDISSWDNITKTELLKTKDFIKTAVFSSAGDKLLTVTNTNKINCWDISGVKNNSYCEVIAAAPVKALMFSGDNKTVYFTTETGEVNYFNVTDKKIVTLFNSKTSIANCLAYSKKENYLAAGFSDGKVRLFNLNENTVNLFSDHTAVVESVTFNQNSTLLATSSADKTIRVYDLTKKDTKPIVLRNQQTKARCISFINNHLLAAGMLTKTIYIWELSSEQIVSKLCPLIKRDFTKEEWMQYVGDGIEFQKTCK